MQEFYNTFIKLPNSDRFENKLTFELNLILYLIVLSNIKHYGEY